MDDQIIVVPSKVEQGPIHNAIAHSEAWPKEEMAAQVEAEGQAGPGPSTRSLRARTTSANVNGPVKRDPPAPVQPAQAKEGPKYIQPDHFSPLNNAANPAASARGIPTAQDGWLSPEDDTNALRGIPVFRPTLEDFEDFEGYVTKTVPWGQYSGITKIIPPPEWTGTLPPITKQSLSEVRVHHPIQQNLLGNAGLFRVLSVVKNKNRDLTIQEWFNKCKNDKHAGPGPKDVARAQNRDSKEAKERLAALKEETKKKKDEKRAQRAAAAERRASRTAAAAEAENHQDKPEIDTTDPADNVPPLDSSRISEHSSPDPIATTPDADSVDPWYQHFDPSVEWLPKNTTQEDYTTEACAALERHFWKNMGMGEPSWYGADMEGSLFVDDNTPWNVAHLPNLLNRWDLKSLPGVNSPYLYFGMWGATFAWHVEDMDLFSINYIHFGAPKFWYAVPQQQAEKLERVLQGYFPEESRKCDQFLRHKSFAVSPYRLANDGVHVNMLVHNQNEFVITYPRGYHAGFNMGFNCAESVNFALDSWLELGRRAKACQCVDYSVKFDVDEILKHEQRRLNGEQELAEAIAEERRTKKPRKRPGMGEDGVPRPNKRPRHRAAEEGDELDITMSLDDPDLVSPTPELTPKFSAMRKKKPKQVINLSPSRTNVKPVIVQENPTYPCLFCPSLSTDTLLLVLEPSVAVRSIWKPRTAEVMVHHSCALAMPGVGIEDREVDGKMVAYAVGVDNIEKSRWALKCSECVDKRLQKSGAKIQCTKGKCPKAYHVSCAQKSDMASLGIWEVHTPATSAEGQPQLGSEGEVMMNEEIKVELLCSQHNPKMKARNEQKKADAFKAKVMALPLGSPIKIRMRNGASMEYTLLEIVQDSQHVVVHMAGERTAFPWLSIDFRPAQQKMLENEYARHHTHIRRSTGDTNADRTQYPGLLPQHAPPRPDATDGHVQRSAPLRVNDLLNPQPDPIPSRVVLCDSSYGPAYPTAIPRSGHELSPPSYNPNHYIPSVAHHSYLPTNLVYSSAPRVHPPPYASDPRVMGPIVYAERRGSAPSQSYTTYPSVLQMGPPPLNFRHSISTTTPSAQPRMHSGASTQPYTSAPSFTAPPPLPQMPPVTASSTPNGSSSSSGIGKIDLGLARMQSILSALKPLTVPAIHLAGTNGKGSVSAILESCLMAGGMRVARYNSPHLVEPRDAIRIDGVPPSQHDYAHAMHVIENITLSNGVQATTFEIATAAAYHLINNVQPPIDVMIIECGLGGARDATNVIPDEITLASALTSVGLDHTAFLGETITAITEEKSKIAVEGGLLVVGPQTHREAVQAASRIAAQNGAKVVEALRSEVMGQPQPLMSLEPFIPPGPTLVRTPLPLAFDSPSMSNGIQPTIETELHLGGEHQLDNLSLALTILHTVRLDLRARNIQPKLANLSDPAIKTGVAAARWDGRCSWLSWTDKSGKTYPVLVDGAHNSDSAKTLREYIDKLNLHPRPPITFVISLSSSQGKTIESVLSPLLREGDQVEVVEFTTPVEGMPWIHPVPLGEVASVASALVGSKQDVRIGGSGVGGVQEALERATSSWHDVEVKRSQHRRGRSGDRVPPAEEKIENGHGGPRLIVLCGSLYLVADVYRLCRAQGTGAAV